MKNNRSIVNSRTQKTLLSALGAWLALSAVVAPAATYAQLRGGARPLPVLLVIADRGDFHYREYADTRSALRRVGLETRVSATSTEMSFPHPGTGEPAGTDGGVVPDLPLAAVDPAKFSAIVFVGGWGSSMYQYGFNDPNGDGVVDNFYVHAPYRGDDDLNDGRAGDPKRIVNRLIELFARTGKPMAAICHGVTVLAWARVDGVSPLRGRRVAAPFSGSPAAYYRGRWFEDNQLGQAEQVRVNGGIPGLVSGQYGDPQTAADDVIVDGRIITAENWYSAGMFGHVIAREVIAASNSHATSAGPLGSRGIIQR